jgi:formylglycine-generating enzyme required for sulfatase activity
VRIAEQQLAAQIAGEVSRDSLLKIAAANAAQRPAVERRLVELGYLRISSSTGEIWRKPGTGESFRDCPTCPQMVVVPAGQFLMGSPASEAGRQEDEDDTPGPGGAQVRVTIPRPFAVGRFEITRGDYAAFVTETRYKMDGGCYVRVDAFELSPDLSWQSPGYVQDDEHPVACVSWIDARAYAAWLSKKTGRTYRLLSEAEWEYAARGAPRPIVQPRFPFGNADKDLCAFGNGADAAAKKIYPQWQVARCNDGYDHTSPTGSFEPNAAGLQDMLGNLWEWVEDCYHDSYKNLPAQTRSTGAPFVNGCHQDLRVLRGGSWSDQPDSLRPASRIAIPGDKRIQIGGFRLARDLGP